MARISAQEKARRAEQQVRLSKAAQAIKKAFGELTDNHVSQMVKPEGETVGVVHFRLSPSGKASMRIEYQTLISEGIAFVLDDGQAEMSLEPGAGEPGEDEEEAKGQQPPAPGTGEA